MKVAISRNFRCNVIGNVTAGIANDVGSIRRRVLQGGNRLFRGAIKLARVADASRGRFICSVDMGGDDGLDGDIANQPHAPRILPKPDRESTERASMRFEDTNRGTLQIASCSR